MLRRLARLSAPAVLAAITLAGPASAQIVLGGDATTPPGTTSGIVLGGPTSTPASSAPLKLDPDDAGAKPVALAVFDFAASANDSATARQFADVVRADLASTGLFLPVAATAYVALSADIAVKPAFADWSAAGVQALVVGKIESANDRFIVQFRLYDVAGASQLFGREYAMPAATAWRRVAHKTADDIFKAITGASGQFDSRIAYVSDAADKTILNIMDQDGASAEKPLTNVVAMRSPRWSPDGYSFVYSAEAPVAGKPSQAQQTTILYSMDLGRREPLAPALQPQPNPDARFSADARFTIFSRKIGGGSKIVLFDLATRKEKVLTRSSASETSPSLSPDRLKYVFVAGSTLAVASVDGADVACASGPAKTCSLGAGANPVWSPAGDFIAFDRANGGGAAIGVVRADGSGERLLTSGAKDTHPAWSPNGRTLVFARESGGSSKLWTIDRMGRNLAALSTPGNAYEPDWSPLLR